MLDWIKEHPYLTGGAVLALVVLYVIWQNAQSSSAAASSSTAAGSYDPSTGTYIPDDTIQQAQLSAQTAIDTAQISANAQVAQVNAATNQAAIAAQVSEDQAAFGAETTDTSTEAGLTLGLVQAGVTTPNTLALLAGQPGAGSNTFAAYNMVAASAAVTAPPVSNTPVGSTSSNGGSGGAGSGLGVTGPSAAPANDNTTCPNGINPDGSCFVPTSSTPWDPYATGGLNSLANSIAASTPGGLTPSQAQYQSQVSSLQSQGFTVLTPNGYETPGQAALQGYGETGNDSGGTENQASDANATPATIGGASSAAFQTGQMAGGSTPGR